MSTSHPFESIKVAYTPPKRPEHIIEGRYVSTGVSFLTEYEVFVDGEPMTEEFEAATGWARISELKDASQAWLAREVSGNVDRYDACTIARMRRKAAFGDPQGQASANTAMFETWLMDNGWRPIMLDALNAYCPGRCLCGDKVPNEPDAVRNPMLIHTHVYMKDERTVSMQFGYGPFQFVFMLSGNFRTFQVPVNADLFQDALDGKLPNLDELRPLAQGIEAEIPERSEGL